MVEELKAKMRKLENLIGFEGKVDVTSRETTKELIRALEAKYKEDLKSGIRLNRLEFYHDLVENARRKKRKSVDTAEKFVLADAKEKDKEKKEEEEEEEEEPQPEKEEEKLQKPDLVVIGSEDFDEWRALMVLSKIYYVLEHPNSQGLRWKRRVSKKKSIRKFSDKDLIEWRVAQNFQLKRMEEWAISRQEARKLAAKSPYNFDDLLKDDESRELEDMFNIMDTQKQEKPTITELEKALRRKRPFRIQDEGMEDWTESYSDDSEESGAEELSQQVLEIQDELDLKIDGYRASSDESSFDEDESISELFSTCHEIPKYRKPIFEEMDQTESMKEWYGLCDEAIVITEPTTPAESPLIIIEEASEDFFQKTDSMEEVHETDYESKSFDTIDSTEQKVEKGIEKQVTSLVGEAKDIALDKTISATEKAKIPFESRSSIHYVHGYLDDEEVEEDIKELIEEAKDEALDKTVDKTMRAETEDWTEGEKSDEVEVDEGVIEKVGKDLKGLMEEAKDEALDKTIAKVMETKVEGRDEKVDQTKEESLDDMLSKKVRTKDEVEDRDKKVDEAKEESLDDMLSKKVRTKDEISDRAKDKVIDTTISSEMKTETEDLETPLEGKDGTVTSTAKVMKVEPKVVENLLPADEKVKRDLKVLMDEAKGVALDKTISRVEIASKEDRSEAEKEVRSEVEKSGEVKGEASDKHAPKAEDRDKEEDLYQDIANAVVVVDSTESENIPKRTIDKSVSNTLETNIEDKTMRKGKETDDEDVRKNVKSMEDEQLKEADFTIRDVDVTAKSAAKHDVTSLEDENLHKVDFAITKPRSKQQIETEDSVSGEELPSLEDEDLDEYKFDIWKPPPASIDTSEQKSDADKGTISKAEEEAVEKSLKFMVSEAKDEALDKTIAILKKVDEKDSSNINEVIVVRDEEVQEEKDELEIISEPENATQIQHAIESIVEEGKEEALDKTISSTVKSAEEKKDDEESPEK